MLASLGNSADNMYEQMGLTRTAPAALFSELYHDMMRDFLPEGSLYTFVADRFYLKIANSMVLVKIMREREKL